VEGQSVISHDLLAAYAADAALEVEGVRGLVDGPRRHRGVRVVEDAGGTGVELHLALEWGAAAPDVARAVQARVADYVARTARVPAVTVDIVIAGFADAR
jgi:uncharacterized alkaline shock family protein YloU